MTTKTTKTKYDTSMLLTRIEKTFGTVDDFCRLAHIEPETFQKELETGFSPFTKRQSILYLALEPEEAVSYFNTQINDKFNTSELLSKIVRDFNTIDDFCKVADLDPVKFKSELKKEFTANTMRQCILALNITPSDFDKYFGVKTEVRGRPKKEIEKTTTPPSNNRYYTVSEASELLNIHRHTLQAKLREGTIKGKLIGCSWRIYRDELFDNSGYFYYYYFEDDTGVVDNLMTPEDTTALGFCDRLPKTEGEIIDVAKKLNAVVYRCENETDEPLTKGVCIYDGMT